MSHQHAFQLFDRNVFESGPYLRAFDALSDINALEHSLLTYLGSLLPNGKGVINEPVSPSIPEIFRATKMSVSTVRRKLRSLEEKGYLVARSVHFLNPRGKSQQGANQYHLTTKAFDVYEGALPAVKEPGLSMIQVSPHLTVAPPSDHIPSHSESESQGEQQNQALSDTVSQAEPQNMATREPDDNSIVCCWEKATGSLVGSSEREAFIRKFEQLDQPIQYYLERIERVVADAKLKRIAQNINFLFVPFEVRSESKESLFPTLDDSDHSKDRLTGEGIPVDATELQAAIDRQLTLDISASSRRRLEILREAASKCSFELSLKLFKKHAQQVPTDLAMLKAHEGNVELAAK